MSSAVSGPSEPTAAAARPVLYRERLYPPVVWWVLAVLLAVSVGGALGFYLGPVWGWGTFAGTLAVATAVLLSAASEIRLDASRLVVGRAVLELVYLARCEALTAEQTVHRSGPGADARAYLALRPYVATSVEVTLDDPVDPVPYWLVATRRPERLAAAVTGALTGRTRR